MYLIPLPCYRLRDRSLHSDQLQERYSWLLVLDGTNTRIGIRLTGGTA